MEQELWEYIPPDSKLVLYFACGDGMCAEMLRQRNPHMTVIGVEADPILRKAAIQRGLFVGKDAREVLAYLQHSDLQVDAWILPRKAWLDDAFSTSCRKELLACLCPAATLLWEISSSHYWQHLLQMISGRSGSEGRRDIREVTRELSQAGFDDVEVVQRVTGDEQEYCRFKEWLQPLANELKLSQTEWEPRLRTEGVCIRGRRKDSRQKPMAIQAVLGETKVCSRVRILEPHSYLATLPKISCAAFNKVEEAYFPLQGRLVWIWQRLLFFKERMVELQKALIDDHSAVTIQEWDDDPLHWEEHFSKSQFIELRSAHAIQTSTPVLAEYFRQFNPEVKVFPNCMQVLPPFQFAAGSIVTIFYGALNRKSDWEPIMPVLNRVLKKRGKRGRVIVVSDKEFFDAVQCADKKFMPFCSYPQYQRLMKLSDVALLPLLPSRFNQMKSDLKFIECAAWGTVALASPTVYADSLEHGRTGLLYTNETEFQHGLEQLLDDVSSRRQYAQNAWNWVRENRLLSSHYRERLNWYESLFARYDELTEAVGSRVPELRRCQR